MTLSDTAIAARDVLEGEIAQVRAELEQRDTELAAALAERDTLTAARDSAIAARDTAAANLGVARRDLDRAETDRARLADELHEAREQAVEHRAGTSDVSSQTATPSARPALPCPRTPSRPRHLRDPREDVRLHRSAARRACREGHRPHETGQAPRQGRETEEGSRGVPPGEGLLPCSAAGPADGPDAGEPPRQHPGMPPAGMQEPSTGGMSRAKKIGIGVFALIGASVFGNRDAVEEGFDRATAPTTAAAPAAAPAPVASGPDQADVPACLRAGEVMEAWGPAAQGVGTGDTSLPELARETRTAMDGMPEVPIMANDPGVTAASRALTGQYEMIAAAASRGDLPTLATLARDGSGMVDDLVAACEAAANA